MTKKRFVFFGTVIAIGIIVGMVIPRLATQTAGSALDYGDANALVNSSERIVLAKYLGETSHKIDRTNASDGSVIGDITIVVRRFENVESLKGEASVGEMTFVAHESADSLDFLGGEKLTSSFEEVSLSKGEKYVLFLRQIPVRPEYNGQYGDVIWAYNGQPSIAKALDSGNLQFKVTDRYKREWDVSSNSDAPFELSKQEIISLVSSDR